MADEAISDPYWWALLKTLDAVFELLRLSLVWAEGCPCHEGLDGIQCHTLPLISLASGRGTVKDKFVAVLHALFLDASMQVEGLRTYCSSIATITT